RQLRAVGCKEWTGARRQEGCDAGEYE
nr:hypothetical protein [Tanacetum cinerariifolium]